MYLAFILAGYLLKWVFMTAVQVVDRWWSQEPVQSGCWLIFCESLVVCVFVCFSLTRLTLFLLVLHYVVELIFHASRLLYFSEKSEVANPGQVLLPQLLLPTPVLTLRQAMGRQREEGFGVNLEDFLASWWDFNGRLRSDLILRSSLVVSWCGTFSLWSLDYSPLRCQSSPCGKYSVRFSKILCLDFLWSEFNVDFLSG